MEEQNEKKRTVRSTLNKKFGVSENIFVRRARGGKDDRREERNVREPKENSRAPLGSARKDFRENNFPRDSRESFKEKSRESFREHNRRSERGDRNFSSSRERSREKTRAPFGSSRGDFREKVRGGRFRSRLPLTTLDREPPILRQRPPMVSSADLEKDKEEALIEQTVLTSATSPEEQIPSWFKKVIALTTEKGREREGNFIAEGVRVVQEMVSNHKDQVVSVYYSESFSDQNFLDTIKKSGVTLHDISDALMEKASTTVTSQGIFAVCRQASRRPDYETSRSIITLVDSVQDPGNLGTLFRTSLGFSSGGMILGKGTVSPFNPKVVRGSSGTFLRVPFESEMDLIERINFLHQKGYVVIATDLHAKQSLKDLPPRKLRKVALLVGNEGAGTNSYLVELADEAVKIPMSSELESLNVSVAHGILSYEIAMLQKDLP